MPLTVEAIILSETRKKAVPFPLPISQYDITTCLPSQYDEESKRLHLSTFIYLSSYPRSNYRSSPVASREADA